MARTVPLLLLVLLATGSSAIVKPKDDKSAEDGTIDRYGQFRVRPRMTFAAMGLSTAAATAVQIAKPAWLEGVLGASAESGLGAALLTFVTRFDALKVTNPLELTMAHGTLLKAIAEVLAQVIPQASYALAWIDPLRLARSTFASVLSSSLTFYYWTRIVSKLQIPRWMIAGLGKTLGTSLTKMVVTQLTYRPLNVFLFLGMQSLFRGDTAREMANVMRTRFRGGLIGGIVFFSISNMIMFSIPVVFLHPIIGAIAGLIFNVWLAMVAYRKAS